MILRSLLCLYLLCPLFPLSCSTAHTCLHAAHSTRLSLSLSLSSCGIWLGPLGRRDRHLPPSLSLSSLFAIHTLFTSLLFASLLLPFGGGRCMALFYIFGLVCVWVWWKRHILHISFIYHRCCILKWLFLVVLFFALCTLRARHHLSSHRLRFYQLSFLGFTARARIMYFIDKCRSFLYIIHRHLCGALRIFVIFTTPRALPRFVLRARRGAGCTHLSLDRYHNVDCRIFLYARTRVLRFLHGGNMALHASSGKISLKSFTFAGKSK